MASSLTISSIAMFFGLSSLFFPAAPTATTSVSYHHSHGVGRDDSGGGGSDGGGLLKIACTVDDRVVNPKTWDYDSCIKVLKSNPNIVSSTTLQTLAVNIINTGISNVSNTHRCIQNALKRRSMRSNLVKALKACDKSYDRALRNFQSALRHIKLEGDYEFASGDLYSVHTYDIHDCQKALASNKIGDPLVLSGNRFASLFSVAADVVCLAIGP